jgi:threonine aldolase
VASQRKSFGSDNHSGAHPEVLRALAEAAAGDAVAYGGDPWTAAATRQLSAEFGACGAFLVFTGSAANVVGLSLLLRPFEAVICADSSHLHMDECGAAERVLGSKLLAVSAPDGKLTPELIGPLLDGRGDEHRAQPRAVEIAQVTEVGTCYTLQELGQLRAFCDDNDLRLYIDGARLANAAAYLQCGLADLAAFADVLSFGGTKNGAVAAEAVIVMREECLPEVRFQRKQLMQLGSKMRFMAAQFTALLEDKLWLRSAQHANDMAQRLAAAVADLPGVAVRYPVQANAVFGVLNPRRVQELRREWVFYDWDAREHVVRWMTAFDTSPTDVDAFAEAIRVTWDGSG